MTKSRLIWISVTIFSTIGGYIPVLLGEGIFSVWGVLGSTVGGVVGIWVAIKAAKMLELS